MIQRKMPCGYINSNWSFKLVDTLLIVLPNTEFGFE